MQFLIIYFLLYHRDGIIQIHQYRWRYIQVYQVFFVDKIYFKFLLYSFIKYTSVKFFIYFIFAQQLKSFIHKK